MLEGDTAQRLVVLVGQPDGEDRIGHGLGFVLNFLIGNHANHDITVA